MLLGLKEFEESKSFFKLKSISENVDVDLALNSLK